MPPSLPDLRLNWPMRAKCCYMCDVTGSDLLADDIAPPRITSSNPDCLNLACSFSNMIKYFLFLNGQSSIFCFIITLRLLVANLANIK